MAGGKMFLVQRARKRKTKKQKLIGVPRPISTGKLFGKRAVINMRWVEVWALNPGVGGTMDVQTFAAGNLQDITNTGNTHQPMGWDQITKFYDHYVVISSKINVKGVNADPNYAQACTLALMDTTTELTGAINQYCEQPGCVYRVLGDDISSSGGVNLSKTYNASRYFSTKDLAGKDNITGQVNGAAPQDGAYYHLAVAPLQTVDAGQCDFLVTVDYKVLFFEPKKLNQS